MAEITVNNVRMHYQLLGEGDRVVVFIHGLIIDDLSSWYFTFASAVAEHSTVLLYDLRGHGRSERTPSGYRLKDMMSDLQKLLESLSLDNRPLHIIANSFGGVLALSYAFSRAEYIDSLILLDAHIPTRDCVRLMLDSVNLSEEEREQKVRESFRNWPGKNNAVKRRKLMEKSDSLLHETSMVDDLLAGPALSEDDLGTLTMPVLAIYGEHSDILEYGEKLNRLLPRCRLIVLEGGSHSVVWESTESLKLAINDWLMEFNNPPE